MTIPTISLNGSTKESLMKAVCEAQCKVHEAMLALAECSPHPRDYQLSKDGDYGRAKEEYIARHRKLNDVYVELEQLAIKIDEKNPDAR